MNREDIDTHLVFISDGKGGAIQKDCIELSDFNQFADEKEKKIEELNDKIKTLEKEKLDLLKMLADSLK